MLGRTDHVLTPQCVLAQATILEVYRELSDVLQLQ
jgi:hypothetical protein